MRLTMRSHVLVRPALKPVWSFQLSRQIVLLQQWQRISSQEQHARPCLQEFVNYTYEKAQEFADSVDKKLHRGVFARSDAFNFGFKRREKPHDALGQVTQVSGRIAAGKADMTTLFRLLKIDTVAHVLFRRQRPARQEGIVFGV